jgi:WD40 repeat protein
LHHCDQNYEGSKILISDKGGYVTLFNFLKNADPNSKGMQLSCNRRNDPVACLEITHGLEQDKIVSCSNDRDLRIWRKEDGVFSKKYDLSSFTNESITSMRLGKDQNMLFLGSKDMNVYLIDIGRGKLCVVYEGHWNKVNIIHTIPERDILITVSESNIKVWDLEYDECIKNMNDHEASIVHVSQYEQKSQQHILTIGSNFEMRMWNYETGEDSKEHKLNIDTTGKVKTVF